MSERPHLNPNESFDPDRRECPPDVDFLDARRRKRELLDELSTGWEQGRPVKAEELLSRWPADPAGDDDVAGLLFQEYQQRQQRGDEDSLADISRRFPEHGDSLASLMRAHDVLCSLGGSSKSGPRLALPAVGDELFGFRMRHELGRGAFACVFMAEQEHLAGRPVVLKVSALEGNEPQTLAQLQHTHIVPIYSVHENVAAGLRAVCMPYFGGASLSAVLHAAWADTPRPTNGEHLVRGLEAVQAPKWIVNRGSKIEDRKDELTIHDPRSTPLTWLRANDYCRAAARILSQLAEGLDHAHERGILHRDIKPSNILLAGDGTPMLLDFNLSEDVNTPGAVASATLGGTVSYMSPEHLRALAARDPSLACKVDHRSDIYSLGMVLYEMLVGQSPFRQSASYSPIPTLIEAMAVERGESSPSLRAKRPDAPWDLESIVRKCLDPNPERRYQRAAHIAEDLEAFLHDRPLKHAPQLSRVERCRKWLRRHPRLASSGTVATVAAVLLLTVGAAYLGMRQNLQSAESQVDADHARNRLRKHDAGTLQALCLINVADAHAHDENRRRGAAVCEKTLSLFGVLDRSDWSADPGWQHLNGEERERLAENTRELLLLLAWARVRGAPDDRAVLRDALSLVQRAEDVPGLAATPALLEERAHYLDKMGDAAAAATVRANAKDLAPTTARDFYLLATTQVRAGDLAGALATLDRAIEINPKHYWSWVQRGLVRLDRREFTQAVGDFGACIGLEPNFAWGYYNLAYGLDQSGLTDSALANYTTAIQLDPDFAMAYQNRAKIRIEAGQHAEALRDLDRALELGRDEASLHASRAVSLEALGRFDAAEAAIQKALATADAEKAQTNEEAPGLRIRWTCAFSISTRKPKLARQLFEEVLTRQPRHAQALYGLGMLAATASRNEEAVSFFDQALEADPKFTHARLFRAVILARVARFEEALQDVNFCRRTEPNSGPALYAAACVASHIAAAKMPEDPSGAREAAEQALDFLDRAFRQGYGRGHVDDDPDLAFVRRLPECRRFLQTKD